jgi:hypothetical protein
MITHEQYDAGDERESLTQELRQWRDGAARTADWAAIYDRRVTRLAAAVGKPRAEVLKAIWADADLLSHRVPRPGRMALVRGASRSSR